GRGAPTSGGLARGTGPLRAGDRGGAGAAGAEARAIRTAVGDRERRGRAGEQHLLAAGDGAPSRGEPPRARGGDALLPSRAADGGGGGGGGRAVLGGRAGGGTRDGRGDGQDGDPRERRAGLPGEPLQPPLRPGGAAPAAGADRGRRDDRPDLPDGGRL